MVRTWSTTVLALVTVAAVTLPAQRDRDFGLSQEEWCREPRRADVCEVREETLSNTRVIDLDARGNGGVVVRGWDRPDVHLRARVAVFADTEAEARSLASEIRLVTTGGRIRVEGPARDRDRDGRRGRSWSIAFELQVPRSAELTVGATNGGVSVRDVRGRMDLRTVNGGIALEDVSGDIRGETTNGGISVRMTSDTWDGPSLEVRTVNGGITLAMPAGLSAELDARAVNGGINVDFPVTVSGLIGGRREIRGTIGSGGPRIRASATNGGVSITRR